VKRKRKKPYVISCKYCNKTIVLFPSQYKEGRSFCSRKCYNGWRKGRTYVDIYGEDAEEQKRKREETHSKTLQQKIKMGIFTVWNKGLTKETDERVRKQGENVSLGLRKSDYTVWSKGLTKETDFRLQKLSKSMKGKNKGEKNHNYGKSPSWAKTRSKFGHRPDLNNQFFRSRWEANFARILNYHGIKWEFENQKHRCYFSEEGITYLPDFYLPDYDLYVEISGYPSPDKLNRLRLFKKYYPEKTLFHITGIEWKKNFEQYKEYIPTWES